MLKDAFKVQNGASSTLGTHWAGLASISDVECLRALTYDELQVVVTTRNRHQNPVCSTSLEVTGFDAQPSLLQFGDKPARVG